MQHAKTMSTCVGNDQKSYASNTQKCFFKSPKQWSLVVHNEEWQRLNNSLADLSPSDKKGEYFSLISEETLWSNRVEAYQYIL